MTDQPAVAALLGMPAERGRPARLDRRHDTALDAAEMRAATARNASPWRRKMSATSSTARTAAAQASGITSSRKRSSGLGVPRMVLVATCV